MKVVLKNENVQELKHKISYLRKFTYVFLSSRPFLPPKGKCHLKLHTRGELLRNRRIQGSTVWCVAYI